MDRRLALACLSRHHEVNRRAAARETRPGAALRTNERDLGPGDAGTVRGFGGPPGTGLRDLAPPSPPPPEEVRYPRSWPRRGRAAGPSLLGPTTLAGCRPVLLQSAQ